MAVSPIELLKAARRRYYAAVYDKYQNAEARTARARIEQSRPDHALDQRQLDEIAAYAADHLGSKVYAPWLETYAAWRGEFLPGWIPDNYWGRHVVPVSIAKGRYDIPVTLARRLIGDEAFPDIGYILRGRLTDETFAPVDPEAFEKAVFADHEEVYVKIDASLRGRGVQRVKRDGFAKAIAGLSEAVIQSPIAIHDDLQRLSPNATPTLRMTTVIDKGTPRLVASYLRLALPGATHIEAFSHMKISVADLETGRLQTRGALPDWTVIENHPATQEGFGTLTVPGFAAAARSVVAWHARVPQVNYLGWDVAIRPDATAQLFEVNAGHAGIKFSEASVGPCFAGLGWDRLHL